MILNLITCNIRFDNPADGDNSWSQRIEFLSKTVLKHGPSLLATQEGRIHQLRELENSLPSLKIVDPHRSWIAERMYPTIFIHESKFEFLGSGDLWLSETPDVAGSISFNSSFPRLMTWTHLQPKNTIEKFFIVNVHLDHVKEETRINQTQVLLNQIDRCWDKFSHLILMGDFNDSPQSTVRKMILKKFPFLTDHWGNFNLEEESSHHGFRGENKLGSRIDWILIPQNLKVTNLKLDKSHDNGKYPSDHFPVVCQITL